MMRRSPAVVTAVVAAATIAVIGTGCSASEPPAIIQHGAGVVPDDTIQDLVTYGDVAVVFEVVAENEVSAGEGQSSQTNEVVGREVTARQVGDAIWERPSRAKAAPNPSKEWVISDGGWLVKGSKRTRLVDDGESPLKVGARYLAIRTYSTIAGVQAEWFSLAYIPLTEGVVNLPKGAPETSEGDLQRLNGVTLKSIESILDATKPNATAAPYMDLDAYNRYQKSRS